MLQPIDADLRIEFISKEDISEPKTVFTLRPLTSREMFSFASDSDNGQLKLVGDKIFKFLELSVVSISNFKEGEINTLLNNLPPSVIAELVQEVGRINKMTGQDQKN